MLRILVPAVLTLLAGCTATGGVATGRPFAMAPGARMALPDGSTLRYAGVASDSRCPPTVQCIRAGDADVLFDHSHDTDTARIVLNTERARSTELGSWQLQLVALEHGTAPRATLRIVTANAGGATP